MPRYVGLDVHKRFIEVCILDRAGKAVFRGRTSCVRDDLVRFAKAKLKRTDRVALESTTNAWPVAEILRPFVGAIVVGNPLKTKAIAEAKVKTDKVDAQTLAQLLRCDYLPEVWQPDERTRRHRALISHRRTLTTQRARLKNQVQGLLGRLLIHAPFKLLWTKRGIAWLQSVELPAYERLMLDSLLRQLAAVADEVQALDARLADCAREEPQVKLLMTLPGVNYVVALGLLAAFGDVGRFKDGDHAASYLGLAPTTRQSGERCRHGRIAKAGNSQARWLLTQAAQHASRHPGPLGAFFRRLSKRKSRGVAITALARKLALVAYLMLKHDEPYRYARPQLIRAKFVRLKAIPPRAPIVPGLEGVYQAASLPKVTPPSRLPRGELKMLVGRKLQPYVREIYQPSKSKTKAKAKPVSGRPEGRPH